MSLYKPPRHWIYSYFPFLKKLSSVIRIIRLSYINFGWFTVKLVWTPIAIVIDALGYVTINLNYTRIGHLCIDFECCLYSHRKEASRDKKLLLICNKNDFANTFLYDLFSPHVNYLNIPIKNSYSLCRALNSHKITIFDVSKYSETNHLLHDVFNEKNRGNNFTFKKNVANKLSSILDKNHSRYINDWVCIHTRDSSYSRDLYHGSSQPDCGQEYRNTSPNNLIEVIELLGSLKIHSFLMGKAIDIDLSDSNYFTNYSKANWKSESMDIYLSSKCLFFLGCDSGLKHVAQLFDRPIISANSTLWNNFTKSSRQEIVFFKKIYSSQFEKFLSISEIMHSPIFNSRGADQYGNSGLTLVENSPDDLVDVTTEMLEYLGLINSKPTNTKEQEVIIKMNKLFNQLNIKLDSNLNNISKRFLLRNIDLIR